MKNIKIYIENEIKKANTHMKVSKNKEYYKGVIDTLIKMQNKVIYEEKKKNTYNLNCYDYYRIRKYL